jgi:2-methylcitrate dehydratase PrpD
MLGARASESALDGRAGLFAGLNKTDCIARVAPFSGGPLEILSVYYKPAPACNYAQTACQAALAVATRDDFRSDDIESIVVKASAAAVSYPGCDYRGPFERILQAKMSIQYSVAATLANRVMAESNYRRLDDAEVARLARLTKLETDAAFTEAYPGAQGSEVILTLRSGPTMSRRFGDVIAATPDEIRARFRSACGNWRAVEAMVDTLEQQEDIAILSGGLAA